MTDHPETFHGCPPDGSGLTPCCGRTPFELPPGDRISSETVTCTGPEVCCGCNGAGGPVVYRNFEDNPFCAHCCECDCRTIPCATPVNDQLTADEARAEVDRLSINLYRAQDALEFVGELCDIADRENRTINTNDVRTWLEGAKCGRQLAAEQRHRIDLRTRIATALEAADYRPDMQRGDLADSILPVVQAELAAGEKAQDTLERVKRLCEMTINQSIRTQAIDQARDTLAVIEARP